MERLADIPLVSQPTGARSERDQFIQKFTDRLNFYRRGTTFRKLSYRQIAVKLSHLTIQDLHAFWNDCDQSANFGKRFWGALKPRANGEPQESVAGKKPNSPRSSAG